MNIEELEAHIETLEQHVARLEGIIQVILEEIEPRTIQESAAGIRQALRQASRSAVVRIAVTR